MRLETSLSHVLSNINHPNIEGSHVNGTKLSLPNRNSALLQKTAFYQHHHICLPAGTVPGNSLRPRMISFRLSCIEILSSHIMRANITNETNWLV